MKPLCVVFPFTNSPLPFIIPVASGASKENGSSTDMKTCHAFPDSL